MRFVPEISRTHLSRRDDIVQPSEIVGSSSLTHRIMQSDGRTFQVHKHSVAILGCLEGRQTELSERANKHYPTIDGSDAVVSPSYCSCFATRLEIQHSVTPIKCHRGLTTDLVPVAAVAVSSSHFEEVVVSPHSLIDQ